MKIKFPKTDRLLGLSAMLISILTLIIFIHQTNIINQQSKLSVKPRLSFIIEQNTNDSVVSFTQKVKNKGLGPAIIKKATILYEGEKYPLDFDEFVFEKFPKIENYGTIVRTSSIADYSTITSNESITIYRIDIVQNKIPGIVKYIDIDSIDISPKWKFQIEYTSMYEDEIWIINDTKNIPKNN